MFLHLCWEEANWLLLSRYDLTTLKTDVCSYVVNFLYVCKSVIGEALYSFLLFLKLMERSV